VERIILKNEYSKNSSDWDKVKQGVPQGSILSPLVFLLYINDLSHIVNNIPKPSLLVDDTSIIFSNSDITDYATEYIATSGTINLGSQSIHYH
jgi:hypothetical protein